MHVFQARHHGVTPEFHPVSGGIQVLLAARKANSQILSFTGMGKSRHRAISHILSVVMMTLITVSMASVVMLWGLNEVAVSRDSFSASIRSRMERAQERIVIEDVHFTSASTATVYVRNTGAIRVVVDVIYVDHIAYSVNKTSIGVRSYSSLSISGLALTSGTTYPVSVATTRGTIASGSHTYQ
jgi:hypothetical protein